MGAADRLCQEAVSFATNRKQFGKPISEHQLIQAMLADSGTEAFAGRAMVLEAARMFDDGAVPSRAVLKFGWRDLQHRHRIGSGGEVNRVLC
ncbi:acyl-CoA dehydrogenase-like protein, partial [Aquamicrobium defluvii]